MEIDRKWKRGMEKRNPEISLEDGLVTIFFSGGRSFFPIAQLRRRDEGGGEASERRQVRW